MKSNEKKEIVQVFELEKEEVIECFTSFLKAKNVVIPDKATFTLDIRINPTLRDIEYAKLTAKYTEEGPACTNGVKP